MANKEFLGKGECVRRKVKQQVRFQVEEAGQNHPQDAAQHHQHQHERQPPHRLDVSIEENGDEENEADGNDLGEERRKRRHQVLQILCETHRPGGRRQGRCEQDHPDEEK
jgi:hypothetical protein